MTMAKEREAPPVKVATSADFRRAIDKAVEDGVSRDGMTLYLTLRDEAHMKMDRSLPVEAISFAGGEMRFLGVKVVKGGVPVSRLELPDSQPPVG
jgi:hypothetical protein